MEENLSNLAGAMDDLLFLRRFHSDTLFCGGTTNQTNQNKSTSSNKPQNYRGRPPTRRQRNSSNPPRPTSEDRHITVNSTNPNFESASSETNYEQSDFARDFSERPGNTTGDGSGRPVNTIIQEPWNVIEKSINDAM